MVWFRRTVFTGARVRRVCTDAGVARGTVVLGGDGHCCGRQVPEGAPVAKLLASSPDRGTESRSPGGHSMSRCSMSARSMTASAAIPALTRSALGECFTLCARAEAFFSSPRSSSFPLPPCAQRYTHRCVDPSCPQAEVSHPHPSAWWGRRPWRSALQGLQRSGCRSRDSPA